VKNFGLKVFDEAVAWVAFSRARCAASASAGVQTSAAATGAVASSWSALLRVMFFITEIPDCAVAR
jgi:hypothetical protein